MAVRTVASVTTRVLVVVLLLSAASAHTAAAVDGHSAATFDHRSLADDSTDGRATDDRLDLSFQFDSTVSAVEERSLDTGERLERAVHSGVQRLSEAHELLPSLAVLGYSRYDGSDPLENEHRAGVYERITDSPGIHISKLSDETVVHRSTVRYHVRVLEDEGLIAAKVLGGKHRLYPVETTDLSLAAAVDDEATAAVLRALLRVEPASVSLLADDLDRAPSTVSYHLSRLAEDGLVTRERDGNAVLTRLSQHVRDALSTDTAADSEGVSVTARADS